MPDFSVPGIYVSEQQYTLNTLRIDTRCLAAFAGITERGPLHEPLIVHSFDEYLKNFGGFDTAGYLPYSVHGFFRCGGSECLIVRIANEDDAKEAHLDLKCTDGTMNLQAASPGHWGNKISVRLWHEGEVLENPIGFDSKHGLWADFSEKRIEKGDVLKFEIYGRTLYRTVSRAQDQRVWFNKPLKTLGQAVEKGSPIKIEQAFYSLTISCGKKRESYIHLSPNPLSPRWGERYINERSTLCRVTTVKGDGLPLAIFSQFASGGTDGIVDIKASDFIGYYKGPLQYRGIGCFESRDDISLISVPDAGWLLDRAGVDNEQRKAGYFALQEALVSQCERFSCRFAVLDVPEGLDCSESVAWAKRFDSANAAAYYPPIDMIDPLDPSGFKTARVPPSGAVCGCIAATDSEKGIFHAPANITVQGAAGVSTRVNDTEYESLYASGINLLKYFPGSGIKIWGARTLSSNYDWRYINVRRTFTRIASSIKSGTQWAVFEPNDKNLRKRLVRQVTGFLLDLWMDGYLAGTTAEQGFFVRCDEELNPPSNIDSGILTFEIGLAIVKPVEFFRITITAEKEGASVYIQE